MTDDLHTLRIETQGSVAVAVIAGEVDTSNAATIGSDLLAIGGHTVVVDLVGVSYLDSAGVAMLDEVRRTCQILLVISEDSVIRRTMQIVGFDQLLPTFSSVEAALASAGVATRTTDVC